jgi:hypothetical protein
MLNKKNINAHSKLTWHDKVGWLQGEVPFGVVLNLLAVLKQSFPRISISVCVIFSL